MNIKFSKVKDVKSPNRAHPYDAGLDFFIPRDMPWESYSIWPQCSIIIPSGIKMEIPKGSALVCLEKSSFAQAGLLIGAKVVDADYQGEIHIHLINASKNTVQISAGQKIAQFVLVPILLPSLSEVPISELYAEESLRGEGKFGSTGNV